MGGLKKTSGILFTPVRCRASCTAQKTEENSPNKRLKDLNPGVLNA